MQIFIDSSISQKYLLISCQPSDSVAKLKASIELKEGIPFLQQSLTFRCKTLNDKISLYEYGIEENSTLILNVKILGGTEKIVPTGNSIPYLRKRTKIMKKELYNFEAFIKDKEQFLPEGYPNIGKLQAEYENKIIKKNEKHKWRQLMSHQDRVKSIAVSYDNRFIVSASEDKSIKVYDLEKKQEYHHFEDAHKDKINSVVLTRDKFLISGSKDRSIKIFDLQVKRECHEFIDAHSDAILSIAVSNDKKFIVSGSDDNSIKIFDFHSKKEHHHFKDAHSRSVLSVTVSNDNRFIVSGSSDQSIKIFDIHNKQEHYHFKDAHDDWVYSVTMSRDNRFIVSGSKDKSIKVFDFRTKQEHHHFKDAHSDWIWSVVISADNEFIVSGSEDYSIKIFNLQTKHEHHHFKDAHSNSVYSVALSRDNRFIFTGSGDNLVKIFDLQSKQEQLHFENVHDDAVVSVAISQDNKFIVSGSEDKSIKIFDLESNRESFAFEDANSGLDLLNDLQNKQQYHRFEDVHRDKITSISISRDNKFLASGSKDKSIKVFSLDTKAEYYHFKNAHKSSVLSVTLSSNSRYLVSGSEDRSIKVFDLQTGQEYHHFKDAHKTFLDGINSVAVSGDNRFIISGSEDMSIKVFDIENKKEHHHFKDAHNSFVLSVTVSSDNKFIVSGSEDGSIKIFDLETKQEEHHFINAHTWGVQSVVVSENNKFIVSGSKDQSIKIFDLETRLEHYHFKNAHKNWIYSVSISRDNKTIVSGSRDHSIKIFSIPSTHEADVFDGFFIYLSSLIVLVSEKFPFFSSFTTFNNYLFSSPNSEAFKDLIICYQDLYCPPYYWTILHIVAIFQKLTAITQLPPYAEFKVPFLLDRYGKTPLHYLISQDNVHYPSTNIILDYIIDYIEDKSNKTPYKLEMIFRSLTPLFPFILYKINPKIRDRYLKAVFMVSYASKDQELPLFGLPKAQQVFTRTSIIHPETMPKIYKEGNDQIMFRTMMLHLDYSPNHNNMYNLVLMLIYLRNEEVFRPKLISQLIDYLWHKTKHVMILLSAPFSVYMILLSIYFGMGTRILVMEIIIVLLSFILLAGEFILMWSFRKKVAQVIWNWLDIGQIVLTIAFFIMKFTGYEEQGENVAFPWTASIIIIIGYVKWVTYLRLFKATRNLIQVIISIMYDMIAFMIILTFIIFGFSLIFLQFDRDNEYPVHLYDTYQVLYGNYDGNDNVISQKLLAVFILFLLNVVLLNLLISIMGDSYDKVQERRLLTDSVTRLEMILKAMAFMRVFKKDRLGDKGFLIYCLPETEEEDSSPNNNEWEGRVNMIKKMLKQNEQKVEESKGAMGSKIEKIEERIVKMEEKIDANKNEMQREINQVKQIVENNHQEMLKLINKLLKQ